MALLPVLVAPTRTRVGRRLDGAAPVAGATGAHHRRPGVRRRLGCYHSHVMAEGEHRRRTPSPPTAAAGPPGAASPVPEARPGMELVAIGIVRSPLTDRSSAPKQGDEGAPEAWLELEGGVAPGLEGIAVGDELLVLTWLDRARRDVLRVRPRDDPTRPERGVFATRSPDRPNPIGLHRVTVAAIDGLRVRVRDLEALDGTPVLDVKPLLRTVEER